VPKKDRSPRHWLQGPSQVSEQDRGQRVGAPRGAPTTVLSKTSDMTKRFQASEITTSIIQGVFTTRRSFKRAHEFVRHETPAKDFLRVLRLLLLQVIAATATAMDATNVRAKSPESRSGGHKRYCEFVAVLDMQLRESARFANKVTFSPVFLFLDPREP